MSVEGQQSDEGEQSVEGQQSEETTTVAGDDEGGRDFAELIVLICIVWTVLAVLAGIGFVLLSDLFAGLF